MQKTSSFLADIDSSWTLFLDRDGVINKKIPHDYVKTIPEFIFLDGVCEAIEKCSQVFKYIIMVTNQQGIGKGLMTDNDLSVIHEYMQKKLNYRIHKIYYAPQLEIEQSEMRKPAIGMALQAQKDLPDIDFAKSVMVGDSSSDMLFGKNAGMKTVFISNLTKNDVHYDICFESLYDFSQHID